jgi:hypothetical protein
VPLPRVLHNDVLSSATAVRFVGTSNALASAARPTALMDPRMSGGSPQTVRNGPSRVKLVMFAPARQCLRSSGRPDERSRRAILEASLAVIAFHGVRQRRLRLPQGMSTARSARSNIAQHDADQEHQHLRSGTAFDSWFTGSTRPHPEDELNPVAAQGHYRAERHRETPGFEVPVAQEFSGFSDIDRGDVASRAQIAAALKHHERSFGALLFKDGAHGCPRWSSIGQGNLNSS